MKRNQNARSFIFVTVLALTILSCSGLADLPGLIATATPTPTNTFTPTPTFTPSPTPTETQTPSSTPAPTGVKIQPQSDGSSLFVDYDNQYQLFLPAEWIVIPLSSKDLANILKNLSEKNPNFKDMAAAFKQLDPNVIRVIAINENSKYMVNGFSTNFTLTAIEDKVMSVMPLDFVTGAKVQVRSKGVIFKANGKIMMVQLATLK